MATKGVLGNDPFQRGAAQRPSESKPAGTAPTQEPKKAHAAPVKKAAPAKAAKKAHGPKEKPATKAAAAPKPVAPKPAASKPSGARAKKAEPSRAEGAKPTAKGKTEAPKSTLPEAKTRPPAEADIAARATTPGVPAEPTRAEARAEEAELLERAAEALATSEAIRELEETLSEVLPTTG
ncbi:MAG TPA: hypothetical protein VF697_26495, partial [Archangium sp.]